MAEFDSKAFLESFTTSLESRYSGHLSALMTPGAQALVIEGSRPVSMSRQCLIDAYQLNSLGKVSESRELVDHAISFADSGSVRPDPAEWMIDGPEIGRGHACMWGAIARTLRHQQAVAWDVVDAERSDSWFGAAALAFFFGSEWKMMGRSLQEWGESRRLVGDIDGARLLFVTSTIVFAGSGEVERSQIAARRIEDEKPVEFDSSFFLGRPPTTSEVSHLTTVLGARNTNLFYRSIA
jgi:hypothetical protein